VASGFIDRIGFDVVDVGPLSQGWRYQRDLPAYGPRLDSAELTEAVAAATR
jgi:8-hydroxy-5-deazaflavin:NADPH oxidoreductase